MASGTLSQPSAALPVGTATSPRQASTAGPGSVVVAGPRRGSATRTASLSASPKRAVGHCQQQGPQTHHPVQWASSARPASATAPTAINPSAGGSARGSVGVSRQSSDDRAPSVQPRAAAGAIATQPAPLGGATADALPPYVPPSSWGFAGDAPRRAQVPGGSGATSAPRGTTAPPAVPKLPTNGLVPSFNSKTSPAPQTPVPMGRKGYSSIQLWTPRSQRQPGPDAKQAAVTREPRELSTEPAPVGRSPSASLAMSPRCYPGMGLHAAATSMSPATVAGGAPSTLMSKLTAWHT